MCRKCHIVAKREVTKFQGTILWFSFHFHFLSVCPLSPNFSSIISVIQGAGGAANALSVVMAVAARSEMAGESALQRVLAVAARDEAASSRAALRRPRVTRATIRWIRPDRAIGADAAIARSNPAIWIQRMAVVDFGSSW